MIDSVYGIPLEQISRLKLFLAKANYESLNEFLDQVQKPLEYRGYNNILKSRLIRIQQILDERVE